MVNSKNFRKIILLLGDIGLLYVSLFLALLVRATTINGFLSLPDRSLWNIHFFPFLIVNAISLVVFYIAGFYDFERFFARFGLEGLILKTIGFLLVLNALIFYLFSSLGIAPKTMLLVFFAAFGILSYSWRKIFGYILKTKRARKKLIVLGDNKNVEELVAFIHKNPQMGYEIKLWLRSSKLSKYDLKSRSLNDENMKDCALIAASHIKKDSDAAKLIYKNFLSGAPIIDLAAFYEMVFNKSPLDELEEAWFLENIIQRRQIYDVIKRPFEIVFAFLFLILFSPILILISLATFFNSPGPVILKQTRVGKGKKKYIHYKVRTMKIDGVAFYGDSDRLFVPDDPRITPLGKILRSFRLDELPQLWNIIKGDLSFVGPRPDFIDFFEILEQKIPYYSIRTVVKPGLSGWAQVHNQFGGSIDEAKERLAFEIYYLKNRSFFLDLKIILKTIRTLITAAGV